MWKKIINNAPTQALPPLFAAAADPETPLLLCSFHEKSESENVIFVRPLKEFSGVQMNFNIFSNFCVYQNDGE